MREKMKKFIVLVLVVVMCVSMTACGRNKRAFELSKSAYDNICIAYEITSQFGDDIYEAWRLGIYYDDEILDEGIWYLTSELSLSEDDLLEGFGYAAAEIMDEDWFEMSDEEQDVIIENSDLVFDIMEDDLFSFCVLIVTDAYILNGTAGEAQIALDEAKEQMKKLSQGYSDYEHYPNLKGYYTTTSSFLDFCNNPNGSFEQVKDTINDYNKEARDYISNLDYIFEE